MKKTFAVLLAAMLTGTMALAASAQTEVWEADQGKVAFEVKKATTQWSPDGKYEEGEYYDIDVKDTWISTVCGDQNGDGSQNAKTAALDVKVAMSYDDENLYLCLQYVDPDGFNFTTAANPSFWDGDILQFGASDANETGSDNRLEIGIGQYSDSGDKATMNWADWKGSGFMADVAQYADYFEVTFDGNNVMYELCVPFKTFSDVAPTVGAQYKVCFTFGWSMENGGYNMWQLASGITGGKSIENHATITLAEAPVVETEAETEAPAADETVTTTATAPQTFDAGVIAAVAAVVSAAGYAVAKKH